MNEKLIKTILKNCKLVLTDGGQQEMVINERQLSELIKDLKSLFESEK